MWSWTRFLLSYAALPLLENTEREVSEETSYRCVWANRDIARAAVYLASTCLVLLMEDTSLIAVVKTLRSLRYWYMSHGSTDESAYFDRLVGGCTVTDRSGGRARPFTTSPTTHHSFITNLAYCNKFFLRTTKFCSLQIDFFMTINLWVIFSGVTDTVTKVKN